jgi:hypothetical protein
LGQAAAANESKNRRKFENGEINDDSNMFIRQRTLELMTRALLIRSDCLPFLSLLKLLKLISTRHSASSLSCAECGYKFLERF